MAFYDDGQSRFDAGLFYDALGLAPARKSKMKIVLNLSKKTILEAIAFAKLVKQKMTGNAKFTTPDPALTAIDTATTECETANSDYESSKATTKQKLDVRNQKWDALNALLTLEGSYVANHSTTGADVESAGFTASAGFNPSGVPGQVNNLSVSAGDNDGSLDAHFDPEPVAKTYEVQTSPDPMTPSTFVHGDTVTKSSCTLTGLTSGSRVWVRVRAINGAGKGPWSEPISKIVP